MKFNFEEAQLDIITFVAEDIITASSGDAFTGKDDEFI